MPNINLDLESLKKLNSKEPTNISDVIVNVITLINIATTLIAVINEKTGNVSISDLFYNISNFLIIFAITISLIFKMFFDNKPKQKNKNKSSKSKKKLNKTDKMIKNLYVENSKKVKTYNIIFFIVLILTIIIAVLDVFFEFTNKIFLSDILYDMNSYIIIGILIPVLIYGLILKYKIKKQYKSLLEDIFEKSYNKKTKKSKKISKKQQKTTKNK